MAKLRHLAIACKDPDAMADFYMKAFDFKNVRTSDGPLAYGHHLSDGTIDLAILRFKSDQIGKGYEVGKNEFLIMDDDELEAVELESTHTIEIDTFVPFAQIDKRYYDQPYYIVPNDEVGVEAFAVIREFIGE